MDRSILAQLSGTRPTHARELRAVAEQHHVAITDLEKTLRRLVRQAERDQDFDLGVLDVRRQDRAALRALDTDGRARS